MGEHVNSTFRGVHLVITDSVSPFAVGKYTGPLVEIFVRNVEHDPMVDVEKYRKEVSEFFDMDDLSEDLGDTQFHLPEDVPACFNFSREFLDFYSFPDYENAI